MKLARIAVAIAFAVSFAAAAQGSMKGMDMKDMDMMKKGGTKPAAGCRYHRSQKLDKIPS